MAGGEGRRVLVRGRGVRGVGGSCKRRGSGLRGKGYRENQEGVGVFTRGGVGEG